MTDEYDWCATCGCTSGCHGGDADDPDGIPDGPCEACDMCNEYVPGGDD